MIWDADSFITALVEKLQARPGLNGIQVTDGWPGEAQGEKSIWLDDAGTTEVTTRMTGGAPTAQADFYKVTLWADVHLDGKSVAQCRAALKPLLEEVFAELAENKRYGPQNSSARVGAWQYRPYIESTGRGAAAKVTIHVTARRK